MSLSTIFKGYLGEVGVALGGALFLPPTYERFRNVTLPVPDGTTQIDHVFVLRFGMFVVETKNMQGWIFGSEDRRNWTQVFPGGRKYPFQNPLRQNYRHVKAVEQVLRTAGLPTKGVVRSLVVFSRAATLKTDLPTNVVRGMGAGVRHIMSFADPVLSEDQVRAACEAIEAQRLAPGWSTRREHVRGLRARADRTAARRCPRCGRGMMLRTAKRGRNPGGVRPIRRAEPCRRPRT